MEALRDNIALILGNLPPALIVMRLLLGITIIIFTKNKSFKKYFLPVFILGFSLDFLDGFLGRHFTSTHFIKLPLNGTILDGYADISLYASSLYFLWVNYREILRKYRYYILILICLQLFSWGYCFIKFGKLTSYHPYSAKVWGFFMFFVIIQLILYKRSNLFLLMFICGLFNNLEEISITYIMPYYKVGVSSIGNAIKLRDSYNAQKKEMTNIKNSTDIWLAHATKQFLHSA